MLKINQLSFQYESQQDLLKNIDFYSENRVIGVIGKNGSGKSTLLKLISGELSPDQGSINILGRPYRAIYELSYYKSFTLEELLDLLSELQSFSLEDLSFYLNGLNLINFLSLPLNKLSQGTYKKIGLLFSFLSNADILLLDEPFESLDAHSIKFVTRVIKETERQVILVDHDISLVDELSQDVIDLDKW
ncbi:TPA: ATP-binding cassette domain-containing protein [Streptococcus suis]